MAVAKLPISNLVVALAATELEAGATVDEAEVAVEATVTAAELEEVIADEGVLVTRLENPATEVLEAGVAVEDEPEPAPVGEEPEGAGELADIELLLAGIKVAMGAEEKIADDKGAAQAESAIILTVTHWATESLWVVSMLSPLLWPVAQATKLDLPLKLREKAEVPALSALNWNWVVSAVGDID